MLNLQLQRGQRMPTSVAGPIVIMCWMNFPDGASNRHISGLALAMLESLCHKNVVMKGAPQSQGVQAVWYCGRLQASLTKNGTLVI
jgi:hypothetical protein